LLSDCSQRGGDKNIERYWINGVFTPADWSCYGYAIIPTSNGIEGWNGRLWKVAKKYFDIYMLANTLYDDATKALRDMDRPESNYTKAAQKRVEANIQAAYDTYATSTPPMDTLITLTKATEKACYYKRSTQADI
jgi:hypothetical protein